MNGKNWADCDDWTKELVVKRIMDRLQGEREAAGRHYSPLHNGFESGTSSAPVSPCLPFNFSKIAEQQGELHRHDHLIQPLTKSNLQLANGPIRYSGYAPYESRASFDFRPAALRPPSPFR